MRQAGDRLPPPKPRLRAKPKRKKSAPALLNPGNVKVPKPAPPRGHAPNVFETPLTRTPTQKMQAQQRRVSARAVGNIERAQAPYIRSTYGSRYVPKELPSHLTRGDVRNILGTTKSPVGSVKLGASRDIKQ